MKLSTTSKIVWLFALLLLLLGICMEAFAPKPRESHPQSPSAQLGIPDNELPGVISSAEKGDLQSIRRLIDHYDRYAANPKQAAKWAQRARMLGDPFELKLLASQLYLRAKSTSDTKDQDVLLTEALVNAERALSLEDSESNRNLVKKIRSEINEKDETRR